MVAMSWAARGARCSRPQNRDNETFERKAPRARKLTASSARRRTTPHGMLTLSKHAYMPDRRRLIGYFERKQISYCWSLQSPASFRFLRRALASSGGPFLPTSSRHSTLRLETRHLDSTQRIPISFFCTINDHLDTPRHPLPTSIPQQILGSRSALTTQK